MGRDDVQADFLDGLANGVGDPYRALLVTGTRGSGKTVLLNRLEDLARERDWVVVSQTTRPGMLSEMTESRLPSVAAEAFGEQRRATITGGNATVMGFGGGVQRQVEGLNPRSRGLRDQLFALADRLDKERGAGVLISLDEVHRSAQEDLRVILQEVQHARRDDAILDLSEHHGDGGSVSWIPVLDIDTLLGDLRSRPHPKLRPGIDLSFPGGPTIVVTDPFGNTLRFCQPSE